MTTPQITHAAFIDDSGTKEYARPPKEYATPGVGGISPLFVFAAALISINEASRLTGEIIDLKKRYFCTGDVEVKSNWLRQPVMREKKYLMPYNLSAEDLLAFVDEFYELVSKADIRFVASIVDKELMQKQYQKPWYPPAVAYEFLLQRLEMEMKKDSGIVTVSIDDMHGATPKGNAYKGNLIRQHARLLKVGSGRQTFTGVHNRLRFVNSAHSHMMQVADVVAYNVYRQFRDYGLQWEDKTLSSLPIYPHLQKVLDKFCMSSEGRIEGYGLVKYPLRGKVRWEIKKAAP